MCIPKGMDRNDIMPLVKVEMLKGKSTQYKEKVLDCIHRGLVDSLQIEDWDRFQRITEYDRRDFEFPGRTKEQKAKAIEAVISNLSSRLSIAPSDVFIVINEPPLENWGMGGKQKE